MRTSIDVQGLTGADGLAMLSQLGPMIQQAMATGNVQISQGQPQVLDLRGTGLREEIMGIMSQHGIDPESGVTQRRERRRGDYGDMQKQILEALPSTACRRGSSRRSGRTASARLRARSPRRRARAGAPAARRGTSPPASPALISSVFAASCGAPTTSQS